MNAEQQWNTETASHSFLVWGLGVDVVKRSTHKKKKTGWIYQQTPALIPTRCLPGMVNVHFYKRKGPWEQRDVQGANEREIQAPS